MQDVHTIDAISAATGIPRSSVHRILQELVKEDVLIVAATRGYVLTPRIVSIGLRGIRQKSIIELAIPAMQELSRETHETVSLHVASGEERICLCRIEGDYPITRHVRVGDRNTLLYGAAGKTIASGMDPAKLEALVDRQIKLGVVKQGEREFILDSIGRARELGYCVSWEERIKGSASIGVPVRDMFGNPQASLTIASLVDRLTPENRERYKTLLLAAAEQIQAEYIPE